VPARGLPIHSSSVEHPHLFDINDTVKCRRQSQIPTADLESGATQ
jgi:hypothetical protein